MATTITLRQFVDNPSGRGSAYLAKRAMIKDGLNMTFISCFVRIEGSSWAVPYIEKNGDIIFWVKVPSELYSINKITYDVLFEFHRDPKAFDKRLAITDVTFFSNSPSFIYTYAYVFNKMGLLIPKFSSKLPSQCLTQAPTMRNPVETLGWEKSIYVAARYLLDGFCLTDSYIARYGQHYDNSAEANLYRSIADPNTLLSIYQHAMYMRAQTHRHKISAEAIKARNARAERFNRLQKQNTPRVSHNGIWVVPRSKITARKATRSILNDGHKPSSFIRPRGPKRKV
jgi:hypothetical protein